MPTVSKPNARSSTRRGLPDSFIFSFYYRDPNGNNVEFSAQNFPTLEAMTNFMRGDYFKANPSGVEISDPDAFVARFRSGVPAAELTRLGVP